MTLFLDGTLKVSLVIVIGLAAASVLRGRSAALRHWVLATTIVAAMAVPVLEWVVPAWQVQIRRAEATSGQTINQAGGPARPSVGPIELSESVTAGEARPAAENRSARAVTLAWILGAVASLLMFATGLTRLFWLASRAQPVRAENWIRIANEIGRASNIRRPITLLQSEHPSLLVTWGLLRPKVLIPDAALQWDEERIRIVLRHELAHIRRGDWAVQLAGELLRAAYWFNPLLWVACAQLRLESERACDDEVLSGGVDGPAYATHLLELARALKAEHAPRLPAPAVARSSSLERRIRAMLDVHLTRKPATRTVRFLTAVALLTVAVAVAAAQTTPVKLSGTVYDSTGAPVPNVAVVLSHSATQAKYEVKSNATGYFEFVPLPADNYALVASLPGFKESKQDLVLSGRAVQRDITLALGSLKETISIRGGPSTEGDASRAASPRTVTADLDRTAFQRALKSCTPSSTGGRVRPPMKIKDVKPVYPESLQAAGIGGTVLLGATIGADGLVKSVEVLRSVHPELDASAVEAVKQWQFDGTLLNCVPSEVSMNVSVDFAAK